MISLLCAVSLAFSVPRSKSEASLKCSNDCSASTAAVVPNKITLLHTNDVHAHFSEFNKYGTDCNANQTRDNLCYGGASRLKTAIDGFRAKSSDVVLLDAGDQFQGTLFFNIFGGNVSTKIMNELRYDAMTVGNHEFDNGIDVLASFVSSLNFPVISSNIKLDPDNAVTKPLLEAGVQPYVILKKYNLGIIGFITNTTASIVAEGEKLKSSILDPIETVQKAIDELQAQGIKRIIGLSHNGYQDDINVARNVRGLQLVVGGHSHSLLLDSNSSALGSISGPYPTKAISNLDNKSTYIVQAHRFGDYLGHLDLQWDSQDEFIGISGEPILLDQSIRQDEQMELLIKEYAKAFDSISKDVVTQSTGNFPTCGGSRNCAMGKLITGCMISEQENRIVKPEIAMINTGGIRATFSTGPVTAAAILTVLPFGNSIMNFPLTGEQIMKVLGRIASSETLSLPQWSGLDFELRNGTVSNVKVKGIDLDVSKSYLVTSIDFLVTGGDNILDKIIPVPATEMVLADLVTKCLRKVKQISP